MSASESTQHTYEKEVYMTSPSRPTLANLKNKSAAVIYLTAETKTVPEVPENGFEFDWFNTAEAASNCFDEMVTFNKQDVADNGSETAFLVAEVTDTKEMKFGRFDVQPVTDETKKWLALAKKDPTHVVCFPEIEEQTKAANKAEAKKRVKPRKKSAAGATVTKIAEAQEKRTAKKAAPKKTVARPSVAKKSSAPAKAAVNGSSTDKAERLRKRLAAKKVQPAQS
jgi:hypothetical protein